MTENGNCIQVKQQLQEAMPEAISALRELLKNKDARVRLEAARLLVEAQHHQASSPSDPFSRDLGDMISQAEKDLLRKLNL